MRSQFSDTAFWKAQVTTDADGQAVVAVPLPDNLTTWRLTALAVTADTQVGQATNESRRQQAAAAAPARAALPDRAATTSQPAGDHREPHAAAPPTPT